MKLSELLDRESIGSVNDKTNISIDILLKLVDGDFEEISRVRALGFVSILKREYDIELEDLEKSIKNYFIENNIEEDTKVIVTVDRKEGDSGLFKWIIIVALLGGLWYLYSSGKLGGNLSNEDSTEHILKDSDILESNATEDNAKKSVIIKKDANKTEVEIQTLETKSVIEERTPKESEVNISKSDSDNRTANDTTKIENNISDKVESIAKKKQEQEKKRESADIENILDENIQETTSDTSRNTLKKTPINEDDIAEIIYNIAVHPRVNLWFGFINIDTKERKEFMTTETTTIDVGEQRWILMTGHGRVTVSSDNDTLKINDRKKHYFYIDSSTMKEITRKEFKKFNGGRGW